ncbi:MAG: hypothetical protein ACE5J6_00850 [Candidatus Bathyarchaeia archaeon]
MSRRKRRGKEKSRKKLAYGVIAVTFILILLAYFFFHQSNPTSQPKAAIVDHLSRHELNQTFVQKSRTILKEAGFDVDYYGWEKLADVNYYKSLFKKSYDLFVLRVHSAVTIIHGEETVGLFTWERYSDYLARTKYRDDVMYNRLVQAFFQNETDVYFGITHKFVEKYGEFQNTVIIMMGCNGLTYTSMAEAFVKKGAKVYISWNELVGVDHSDRATVHLLQSLLLENRTIKEAVEEIGRDPTWNSSMGYYPSKAGGYGILDIMGGLAGNHVEAIILRVKFWYSRVRALVIKARFSAFHIFLKQ